MKSNDAIPESTVLKDCLVAASECGARVFRNNVGLFTTIDGRKIKTGLLKGSADLIGIAQDGTFLSIECKRPVGGELSPEQKKWMDMINKLNGIAIVAKSGDDVRRALGRKPK